jgi:RNA polymerase sigma factor (sigma-70 family)
MTTPIKQVVQHLRRAGLLEEVGQRTDGQLLERFINRREEAALETLVRRHGPMVWGVCRRVLGNHHDAEDAFQAAFLVLVRKAGSIRPREMVGNWLYGVAHQTALKARATLARLRTRERQGVNLPEPAATSPPTADDWQAVLDQELSHLPDKYRVAIVLCDLEGKTRKEAARQLGVPEGTLAARVARGRMMLANRLARHGLVVAGGALAAVLSRQAASACVPSAVLSITLKAVNLVASGQGVGAVAASVAQLTEGVLKAMLMTKVKAALGICLVLGLLMMGSAFGYRTLAADKPAPEPPKKDHLADTLILLDKQLWQATSSHDLATFDKLIADDWTCQAPKWTKAQSVELYKHHRYVEVNIVGDRKVYRIDKHTALMSYEVKWRAEGDIEPRTSYGHNQTIHIWVERDGGWVIKHTETVDLLSAKEAAPAVVPSSGDPKLGPLTPIDPRLQTKPETPWKKGVRANGVWQNEIPENAFDGKGDSDWNSGDYAPGWIERDLGTSKTLASITLVPCQDIPGPTIHEVWVSSEPIGNDRSKAKLVHTFKGETSNRQALKFDFPKDTTARYVLVRTTQSPTWIAWCQIEIRVREEKVVPLDPEAPRKQTKDDKEALQGTWQVVSVETGGKDVTQELDKHQQWVVKDGWITIQFTDQLSPALSRHREVFAVRPDKNPKEIDVNAHPVGVYMESDNVKGIYTLDGDVWKVCQPYSPLDGPQTKSSLERPKEMTTKGGGTTILITLKRVKNP